MKLYLEFDITPNPESVQNCKYILKEYLKGKGITQREYDEDGETEISRACGGYDRIVTREEIVL